jgi:hypothetical protein
VLEVHREPAGDAYQQLPTLTTGQRISPLAAPDCTMAVADLLP